MQGRDGLTGLPEKEEIDKKYYFATRGDKKVQNWDAENRHFQSIIRFYVLLAYGGITFFLFLVRFSTAY